MRQAGEQREVNLAELVPHPRNYRQHPEDQTRRIAASLQQHGQYRPVVVQAGTMRIIAGHGVVAAAKAAGEKTIAATVIECSDEEALQILVDDNELARKAEDSTEDLLELLADLKGTEWEPAAFDDADIEDLLRSVTAPRMTPPEEFPEYDESIAEGVKTATCPECGHEFPV